MQLQQNKKTKLLHKLKYSNNKTITTKQKIYIINPNTPMLQTTHKVRQVRYTRGKSVLYT